MAKSKTTKKVVAPQVRDQVELMHWAWTVIANAYGGDWSKAKPEWRDAATTWKAAYYRYLDENQVLPKLIADEADPSHPWLEQGAPTDPE